MKILLDTCAFLWLVADSPELSETAKTLFRDIENQTYLSTVSAWEIIVKNRLGKLPLPEPAPDFIQRQCRQHLIETLPLDNKAVFQLHGLANHHRDPFDRMLICQALSNQLVILTTDELIAQYPVATVW